MKFPANPEVWGLVSLWGIIPSTNISRNYLILPNSSLFGGQISNGRPELFLRTLKSGPFSKENIYFVFLIINSTLKLSGNVCRRDSSPFFYLSCETIWYSLLRSFIKIQTCILLTINILIKSGLYYMYICFLKTFLVSKYRSISFFLPTILDSFRTSYHNMDILNKNFCLIFPDQKFSAQNILTHVIYWYM